MIDLFDSKLYEIDRRIASAQPSEVPHLFREIPLDFFGELLLDVPTKFPNIKAFFPSMPPDDIQDSWTGNHGVALLAQSTAFIKTLVAGYTEITGRNLENATILDFGCGWGRLIRLLYKFTSYENIYAVDPWDRSIEECIKHGVKAHLALSEYVPRRLPFERQFDLIFALSVFTHLSEKTASVVLTTLRRYIADHGVLVITIRPKEYWYVHNGGAIASKMIEIHEKTGFAFSPHNRPPIDGDITYGDTSISLDYIARQYPQWKLVKVEYNVIDPYQVILFLLPVNHNHYREFRQWLRVILPLWVRRPIVKAIRRLAPRRSALAYYKTWLRTYEFPDILEAQEKSASLKRQPLFSLLLFLSEAGRDGFKRTLDSLRQQAYRCWELHISAGEPVLASVHEWLDAEYWSSLRLCMHSLEPVAAISEGLNTALARAKGDFIALVNPGDELAPHALYEAAKLLNIRPEADLIYSDEDEKDAQGHRVRPFFKPDWSPDLLLSCNYLSRLVLIRTELVKEVGGFRVGLEGSEDYDLYLRVVEKAGYIAHIPKLLYHRGFSPTKGPRLASPAARRALVDCLCRRNLAAEVVPANGGRHWRVKYVIRGEPEVAVIIPTGGNMHLLRQCLQAMAQKTNYPAVQVVIVDNSRGEAVKESFPLLTAPFRRALYLDCRSRPFNYSRLNNDAVRATETPVLLFLNDDIVPINADWMEAMLEHALRPEVGAVGAKLIYPNNTIQHAGVIMGIYENSSHAFKHLPADESKEVYFDLPNVVRNCSAVTGACLMTRRDVFWEVGGFEEIHLPVAFQDVDLCLKMRERGYLIVYTPYAQLFHYESQTKAEKNPNAYEVRYMRQKWAHVIAHDPYYNPNLTRSSEDFALIPPE